MLRNIAHADRENLESLLRFHGVETDVAQIDPITRKSIACPAFPLCGLAITEAERVQPQINARLWALLCEMGLSNTDFVTRTTGCPNGCARPYMAELGFVGDGPSSYQIWLGGTANLLTLARPFADKVKEAAGSSETDASADGGASDEYETDSSASSITAEELQARMRADLASGWYERSKAQSAGDTVRE